MTDSAAQKRAEEIAKSIYQELMLPKTSLKYGDPTELIVKAITQYADERVKEAEEESAKYHDQHLQDALRLARNDALEEAAKIAEANHDCYQMAGVAQAIRSLATELRGKAT